MFRYPIMSDDDDLIYVKKQNNIHYGSIEEQERQRLQSAQLVPPGEERMDDQPGSPTNEHTESVPVGNIHTSDGNANAFKFKYNLQPIS